MICRRNSLTGSSPEISGSNPIRMPSVSIFSTFRVPTRQIQNILVKPRKIEEAILAAGDHNDILNTVINCAFFTGVISTGGRNLKDFSLRSK